MSRRQIRVVGAMLEKEPGRYLITQRYPKAALLRRELKERLGLDVEVDEVAASTHHQYPTYDVDFRVFHCRLADPGQPVSHARVNDHRWVTLDEMGAFEFPHADAKTLAQLLELEA